MQCMRCGIVIRMEREMELLFPEIVRFSSRVQIGQLQLKIRRTIRQLDEGKALRL